MRQKRNCFIHTTDFRLCLITEGVHLYDTDGNAYLDFAAGIAVCALGYSNEHHKEALKARLISFYTHQTFTTMRLSSRRQTRCLMQAKWTVFSLPTAVTSA